MFKVVDFDTFGYDSFHNCERGFIEKKKERMLASSLQ